MGDRLVIAVGQCLEYHFVFVALVRSDQAATECDLMTPDPDVNIDLKTVCAEPNIGRHVSCTCSRTSRLYVARVSCACRQRWPAGIHAIRDHARI